MTAAALVTAHLVTEPLALLEQLSRRLANVVSAISRRRDVRDIRARLLLVLLARRCPERGRPQRPWYVPGAVARMSPDSIRRAWREMFGEEPPVERSIRVHLATLEQACAIARQPGDWLPYLFPDEDPAKRPRYADTIHLLVDDRDAEWWAIEGAAILRAHPEVRRSPRAWRQQVGDWRRKARERQLDLFPSLVRGVTAAMASTAKGGNPHAPNAIAHRDPEAAKPILAALRRKATPAELLATLGEVKARIEGPAAWHCLRRVERFRGACALLASALVRGDRIRSRAAWLMSALRSATSSELAAALERAGA